jgi:hypothetical protein
MKNNTTSTDRARGEAGCNARRSSASPLALPVAVVLFFVLRVWTKVWTFLGVSHYLHSANASRLSRVYPTSTRYLRDYKIIALKNQNYTSEYDYKGHEYSQIRLNTVNIVNIVNMKNIMNMREYE